MQYMYCPTCGNTISTTDPQCPKCGTQFSHCCKCGKSYVGRVENCPNCGNKLNASQICQQPTSTAMLQSSQKYNPYQATPSKKSVREKISDGYKKYKKVRLGFYIIAIVILGIIYLALEFFA